MKLIRNLDVKVILSSLVLTFLLFLDARSVQAGPSCELIFVETPKQVEVRDLKTFGQAMTEGMLLHPEQADLFEVYRKVYFGDANTSVDAKTLNSVTDILKNHPELQKRPFREYDISRLEKIYETPENLAKYLKSQIQTAGQVRSNLLQIEANLGFWRKVFNYQDPIVLEGLTKDQKKEFQRKSKERFERYLNRIISKASRDFLLDPKEDYQKKTKTLFSTLKRIQELMDKKTHDTQMIRQAMVDLVNTVGYGNQATQSLLKSKNAIDKIEGLKKILDERDSVAIDLEYAGHFEELQSSLKIEFPTGLSKNEDANEIIRSLEREALIGKFTTKPAETLRVRSLSIQESPFRSCLGGSDCSSRTYFSKALDPNFNYFTMTDTEFNSSGHVTVVLGEATNPQTNQLEKVAFIDKLQNVSNQRMPSFLQAVSMSLAENGYKLGVPEEVGDHNGLSNMDTTRHYVANEIVPKLSQRLTTFVPHSHQYNFENKFSRAYNKLNVKIYEPVVVNADTEIRRGREYKNFEASKDLDRNKLIQDLLNLKNSSDPNDVLKYVSSGQVVAQLEKIGLFSVKEFERDLGKILKRLDLPFNIRKQVVFEALLLKSEQKINELSLDFTKLDDNERTQIASEIKQWSKSSDKRRKKFADSLSDKWSEAVSKSEIKTLEEFFALKLFDINSRNESGFSTLLIAIHTNRRTVVEWLIENPKLDLNMKDELGFTDVEQIRLMGQNEWADWIEKKRPESKSRKFEAPERNTDRSPIIDFVKIPGGTFKMGGAQKVTVTITKSFEFASTQTTQKTWKAIIDLANKHLRRSSPANQSFLDRVLSRLKLKRNIDLSTDPSEFKGKQNPVEKVSYDDTVIWIQAANELSKLSDPKVQKALKTLFPGHKQGDVYRLPTEAEWEYVARMRGLATGEYAHGSTEANLGDYAWHRGNGRLQTHPVGEKKPIMILGKPIYDIYGNVSEWTHDRYDVDLPGGIDPQGPIWGPSYTHRGGSWDSDARFMRPGQRFTTVSEYRWGTLGFRLVRTSR